MSDSRRIAMNTLMLYFRQILIMLVSLYTVRVVLSVLGAEDYGIYNVVAGVVTMFGFLSGAMAMASQRYFSFDIGKGDSKHLNATFSVMLQIYVLFSFVLLLCLETIGVWFINNALLISLERMTAANWIFQSAILSFFLTLITTPYMACIIAHENMSVYAYVSIIETGLKLAAVFLLKLLPYDKLTVYGILLALIAGINTSVYRFYCRLHYSECKFHLICDKKLFKEITGYCAWNLFGSLVGVVKNQGVNILLNIHFGTVVNASRGIASQVNNAVCSFSQNFSTAIRPHIIKLYAANKTNDTMQFVFRGCKFTFYLMFIFVLPLFLEMNIVLQIWLKNPPDNVCIFTRLALLDALLGSVSYPLASLAHATGKMRLYQTCVEGTLLLNLPLSWAILRLYVQAYMVMVVVIAVTAFASIIRLLVLRNLVSLQIGEFLAKVLVPCLLVTVLSSLFPLLIHKMCKERFVRLCLTTITSIVCTSGCVLLIGMTAAERLFVIEAIKEKTLGFWRKREHGI